MMNSNSEGYRYSLLFEKDGSQYEFTNPNWNSLNPVAVSVNSRGTLGDCSEELTKLFSNYEGGSLNVLVSRNNTERKAVVRSIHLGYVLRLVIVPEDSIDETEKAICFLKKDFQISKVDRNWIYIDCLSTKEDATKTANRIIACIPVTALCYVEQYVIGDDTINLGLIPPQKRLSQIKVLKNGVFNCKVVVSSIWYYKDIEMILASLGANNIILSYKDKKYIHYTFDKDVIEDDFYDRFYDAIECPASARWNVPLTINRDSPLFNLEGYRDDGFERKIVEIRNENLYDFSGDDSSLNPCFW